MKKHLEAIALLFCLLLSVSSPSFSIASCQETEERTYYADIVEYYDDGWTDVQEILGVEDNSCAIGEYNNQFIHVSFPYIPIADDPVSVIAFSKVAQSKGGQETKVWAWHDSENQWVYKGYIDNVHFYQTSENTEYFQCDVTGQAHDIADLQAFQMGLEHSSLGGSPIPRLMWSSYVDSVKIVVTGTFLEEAFTIWLGLFFFSGLVMVVFWVGLKRK